MLLYQNTNEHKFRIQRKANLKMYCMSKSQLFCVYLLLCEIKIIRLFLMKILDMDKLIVKHLLAGKLAERLATG